MVSSIMLSRLMKIKLNPTSYLLSKRNLFTHTNKTNITHIKQLHTPRHPMDQPLLEKIAFSQYKVAKTILAHPHSIVAHEDIYKTMTPTDVKDNRFVPLTHKIFPNGIPESFTSLNPVQKEYLAKIQGAKTLYYLGKLSHIYKTASEQEAKRINSGIAIGRLDLIFEARETLALTWSHQAALHAKNPHILLVYGAGHNFKSRIEQLHHSSIVFKKSINTTQALEKPTKPIVSLNKHSLVLPKECKGENLDELYENFIPSTVKELINKKLTTLKELQDVYEKSPYTIEKLLSDETTYDAFLNQQFTLQELLKQESKHMNRPK